MQIEIYQKGLEMDFTLTEAYIVPIVSQSFKEAISTVKNLQFIPITFDNLHPSTNYFIMTVNKLVDAVDEEKSLFKKYVENDPIRPDRAGEYRSFFKLIVDKKRINNENIFRLSRYSQAIIIDDFIKSKIEGFSGVKLTLVS